MPRGRDRLVRTRYLTPAKGTNHRKLLLLLLQPQGITACEAEALGHSKGGLSGAIESLRNFGGWDIRGFPVPNPSFDTPGTKWRKRTVYAYKIVGRNRWHGGYRSLINAIDNDPQVVHGCR